MIKLPKDFLLGASISGPQSEGKFDKHNQNVYDYWFDQEPSAFYDQVGPNKTSNMYHNYQEDIKLFKKIGIKIYRTSIQWTRLIKDIEHNTVDMDAYQFYRDYFLELQKVGIKVIVNIYHFDTPMYWQNKGGWLNKDFLKAYADYAQTCFEMFGDIVDLWATMNEPIVIGQAAYAQGLWYPKEKNLKKAVQVCYNQILASALTIERFRKIFKEKPNKQITTMLNLTPFIPKNNQTENLKAAQVLDLLHNRAFLDPMIKGAFPKELKDYLIAIDVLPTYTKAELLVIKNNTIDFLGVNYYAPFRVQAPLEKNKNNLDESRFYEPYIWEQAKMNKSRGWEIYPEGLKIIADVIMKDYNNIKWWVSENGIGIMNESQFKNQEGQIQDDYRIEFMKEHLAYLNQAIQKGANCFAYCVWTVLDCWSWANAYKNRYGLIEVDSVTQKRILKKSSFWFKQVSETKDID